MTNEIINNGWYAVQIGTEDALDRGSEKYEEALKIANDFANNSDYDGQEIRIITCDIYKEDRTLSECTNEEIIRNGYNPFKELFLRRFKCDTLTTLMGLTDEAKKEAEKYIESYANDYIRQHDEHLDIGDENYNEAIDEVVKRIADFYLKDSTQKNSSELSDEDFNMTM